MFSDGASQSTEEDVCTNKNICNHSCHCYADFDFGVCICTEECRADTAVLYSTVPGNDLVRPVVHTICKRRSEEVLRKLCVMKTAIHSGKKGYLLQKYCYVPIGVSMCFHQELPFNSVFMIKSTHFYFPLNVVALLLVYIMSLWMK